MTSTDYIFRIGIICILESGVFDYRKSSAKNGRNRSIHFNLESFIRIFLFYFFFVHKIISIRFLKFEKDRLELKHCTDLEVKASREEMISGKKMRIVGSSGSRKYFAYFKFYQVRVSLSLKMGRNWGGAMGN